MEIEPSSSTVGEDQIRKKCELLVPVPVHSSAATICQICVEPFFLSNNSFNNGGKCSHPICRTCMIRHIRAKLEDNISKIRCPGLECNELLEPLNCRRLVDPELFVRWCDALCEVALSGVVKSYCPNRNCSALIVNECGGIVKRVVCPNCKGSFCFQCKIPWHDGLECSETRSELSEFDWNDRASGELAQRMQWKRCPRCYQFIELIGGCQTVRCRCRASFCYVCGKQLFSSHWCRSCSRASPERNDQRNAFVVFLLTFGLLAMAFGIFYCASGYMVSSRINDTSRDG